MKCLIAVMSYNRGGFLRNCIRSIEENVQFAYTLQIYDDASTDRVTSRALLDLSGRYSVFGTQVVQEYRKVKGLYANMNNSLRHAIDGAYDWLFIIQDDMQVIRPVAEPEISILSGLKGHEIAVPLFFKKNHQKDYRSLLVADAQRDIYLPASKNQVYMNGVADVGIFNVQGLQQRAWVFCNDEGVNITRGRELGFERVVFRNPFVAYLPWPDTKRNSRPVRRIIKAFSDVVFRSGFHPFEVMDRSAIDRMLNRDIWDIPFAEDYLKLRNKEWLLKPWNYYDSTFPLEEFARKIKLFS